MALALPGCSGGGRGEAGFTNQRASRSAICTRQPVGSTVLPTPACSLPPSCRLGDLVGVTLPAGQPGGFGAGGSWFEGVCEKVDLR